MQRDVRLPRTELAYGKVNLRKPAHNFPIHPRLVCAGKVAPMVRQPFTLLEHPPLGIDK